MAKVGLQRRFGKKKPDEYVFDRDEPVEVRIQKSLLRQRNLQELMKDSQVCIVANPYLVALDGLPNIDFIYKDIKRNKVSQGIPDELKKFRKESNLRRLSRIELSAVLNRQTQTKKTKKFRQSESLNAAMYIENSRQEKEYEAQLTGKVDKKY